MFLLILTITLCLTKAIVNDRFNEITPTPNYSTYPIYNVYEWVIKLQLQRCALVAIGLKYFAIFVEDEILGDGGSKVHRKYFLGVCQQDILEQWSFCTPALAKKRKYKCRFKLKGDRFQPRVHRRFCDFKVMLENKDCKCAQTVYGDQMFKVKGFPTCYMPPLPNSLCKYNVCGLNQCEPVTLENRIHTVNCSSKCKGNNPFCERPSERTSRFPVIRSFWSKWKGSESRNAAPVGKKVSVASCINKYTNKGGLDCLGPGTGCCPKIAKNCTCDTFEEKNVLKVKRTLYKNKNERQHRCVDMQYSNPLPPIQQKHFYRYVRGANDDDDDIEDDDDDEGDLDEDIVLDENEEEEKPISTTEDLEKEEAIQELKKEALEEIKNATNSSTDTGKNSCESILYHQIYLETVLVVGSVLLLWC